MSRSYESTPAIPEIIEDVDGRIVGTSYPLDTCSLLIELDGTVRLVAEQSIPLSDLRRLRATIDEVLQRGERAGV
jgi:hypothetical protein